MRYWATEHAAKRLLERFRLALNEIEAKQLLRQMASRAVEINRRTSKGNIAHLLDTVTGARLVVERNKGVIITVYNVRGTLIDSQVEISV